MPLQCDWRISDQCFCTIGLHNDLYAWSAIARGMKGHAFRQQANGLIREQMEDDGLIHRKVYAEVPPRVEYSLTDTGQSLKPVIDAMWNWDKGYKAKLAAN